MDCDIFLAPATTFTGTTAEVRAQLREPGRAGFDHVGVTIRHGYPEMLEEWADVFESV